MIPGCTPCTTVADCDDKNRCTEDGCRSGVCAHEEINGCSQCTPSIELCGDGLDNDCDDLVDCADPNCEAAPLCAPHAEVCGDCQDNDGDDLVDFEDPDCCRTVIRLDIKSLKLRSRKRGQPISLDLKGEWGPVSSPAFDPLSQDSSVQMSDRQGPLLCTSIDARRWKKQGNNHVTFRNRTEMSGNSLDDCRFHIRKDGEVTFEARAELSNLRNPDSRLIRVTVRVGDLCAQATAESRLDRDQLR
jgi:hypothetical protein